MIEAERAFEKTTVSFVKPSYAYDSEIDVALYVIALPFRRGVTEYDNFNAWYNGSKHVVLRLREESLSLPLFVNSSLYVFIITIIVIIIILILYIAMRGKRGLLR